MIDRSSPDPTVPDPDAVRRSLRALADDAAPGLPDDPSPGSRPTAPSEDVADAERAAADAREAAAFVSADRLPELDDAIAAAAARGDDDLAERGRTARRSLWRLDGALTALSSRRTVDPSPTTFTPVAERF